MCVCTITPQQLELDLAHTLKTPSAAAPSNDLFMPTEENFKAAVDVVLRESDWFEEWADGIITANVDNAVSEMVEEDVRSFFNNWDPTDYFDMDHLLERAVENLDLDDDIESHVDNWLCNNLEVDDAVNDAVDNWMSDNFDPEEHVGEALNKYFRSNWDKEYVAGQQMKELMSDQDFINALAAAIVKHQQQQEFTKFALQNHAMQQAAINQADAVASMFSPVQGDSND